MISSLSLSFSQEEHGHLVLLGIFDSVDDTVLVSKIILSVRHQQQQHFKIDFNFLISLFLRKSFLLLKSCVKTNMAAVSSSTSSVLVPLNTSLNNSFNC